MKTFAGSLLSFLFLASTLSCTGSNVAGGGSETGNGAITVVSRLGTLSVSGPEDVRVYFVPRDFRPAVQDTHAIDSAILPPSGTIEFTRSTRDTVNFLALSRDSGVYIGSIPVCSTCSFESRALLWTTGTVEGVVRNQDGQPLDSAIIQVDGTLFTTPVLPDGSFRISGLPAGSFSVLPDDLISRSGDLILSCSMNPGDEIGAIQSGDLHPGSTLVLDTIVVGVLEVNGVIRPAYRDSTGSKYFLDSQGNRRELVVYTDSIESAHIDSYGVMDQDLYNQLVSMTGEDTAEVWIMFEDTSSCGPARKDTGCTSSPSYQECIDHLETLFGRSLDHRKTGTLDGRMVLKKEEIVLLKHAEYISFIASATRLDTASPLGPTF